MPTGPLAFYTLAANVVTELELALRSSEGGRVERACVVPGQIAWDDCQCGALYVSPTAFFLSDDFPATLSGSGREIPCELAFRVVRMTIQVLRCAPSPVGNQISVQCPPLDAAARVLVSDAHIVQSRTLSYLCELKSSYEIVDFALGDQTTVGPEGSCVGSELVAYASLPR